MKSIPIHLIPASSFPMTLRPMLMAAKGQALRSSPCAGTALVLSHLKSWMKDTNLSGIWIPTVSKSRRNIIMSLQWGQWKLRIPELKAILCSRNTSSVGVSRAWFC